MLQLFRKTVVDLIGQCSPKGVYIEDILLDLLPLQELVSVRTSNCEAGETTNDMFCCAIIQGSVSNALASTRRRLKRNATKH